jgi:predicted enzyme related to lactoylglutathione lyase
VEDDMFEHSPAYSGFAVRDLDAARAFYGGTLHLTVEPAMGGQLLDLTLSGSGAHVLIYPKDDHVPATYTILNFPVDDVDAAVDALVDGGLVMQRYEGLEQDTKGISRDPRGPTIAWFTDPSGNILAVHSREDR